MGMMNDYFGRGNWDITKAYIKDGFKGLLGIGTAAAPAVEGFMNVAYADEVKDDQVKEVKLDAESMYKDGDLVTVGNRLYEIWEVKDGDWVSTESINQWGYIDIESIQNANLEAHPEFATKRMADPDKINDGDRYLVPVSTDNNYHLRKISDDVGDINEKLNGGDEKPDTSYVLVIPVKSENKPEVPKPPKKEKEGKGFYISAEGSGELNRREQDGKVKFGTEDGDLQAEISSYPYEPSNVKMRIIQPVKGKNFNLAINGEAGLESKGYGPNGLTEGKGRVYAAPELEAFGEFPWGGGWNVNADYRLIRGKLDFNEKDFLEPLENRAGNMEINLSPGIIEKLTAKKASLNFFANKNLNTGRENNYGYRMRLNNGKSSFWTGQKWVNNEINKRTSPQIQVGMNYHIGGGKKK